MRDRTSPCLIFLLFLVLLIPCAAVAEQVPGYVAVRLAEEPVLDGMVKDDPAWGKAAVSAGEFRVFRRKRNTPKQTRFKMGYTLKGMYFAIECDESDVDRVKATAEDMGKLWKEDSVEVFLMPADSKEFYHIIVNAIGSRYNGKYLGSSALGAWHAMTFVGEDYWAVEILIPFETLAAFPISNADWRVNVCRNIYSIDKPGGTSWAVMTKSFHEPHNFGTLSFSGSVSPQERKVVERKIQEAGDRAGKVKAIGRLDHGDQVNSSSDSKRILFPREGAIIERDVTSGRERTVSPNGWSSCAFPSYLPDGRILFVSMGEPDRLFLRGKEGATPELLIEGEIGSTPRCSPDGQWIAYQEGAHIWLLNLASKRCRQLTFAGGVQTHPTWSVNSKGVYVYYRQSHEPFSDAFNPRPVKVGGPDSTVKFPPDRLRYMEPREPLSLPLTPLDSAAEWKFLPDDDTKEYMFNKKFWRKILLGLGLDNKKLAGSVVIGNNQVMLVLSDKMSHALLVPLEGHGLAAGVEICPLDSRGKPCRALKSITLRALKKEQALLKATFASSEGKPVSVLFTLHGARPFIGITPLSNMSGALVRSELGWALLPDRFANDLIFDPKHYPAALTTLPYAPFTLFLPSASHAAMLMAITPSRKQTIQLVKGDRKNSLSGFQILSSDEQFYVAALTGENLWQQTKFSVADKEQTLSAKWSSPIRAQWRAVARKNDRFFSMMVNTNTPISTLELPIGPEEVLSAPPSPSFIYLHDRTRKTPTDLITPMDLVRDILGLKGTEELIDIRGIRDCRVANEWVPFKDPRVTFLVLGWIGSCKRKGVAQTIGHFCDDIVNTLQGLEKRIGEYEAFFDEVTQLCDKGKSQSPGAARFLEAINQKIEKLQAKLRTPPAVSFEKVKTASDKLKSVAERGSGWGAGTLAKFREYKKFKKAAETAFEERCRIIATYRQFAKDMRDRAGLAVAADSRLKDICEQLRKAMAGTLRNRYFLEADWRGETPLKNQQEVYYEKIKDL